jgi:hypothetical protein
MQETDHELALRARSRQPSNQRGRRLEELRRGNSRTGFKRLSNPSGSEVQIAVAERYRRLTTSSAQILVIVVFDLSYFYAIAPDFHTLVQYRFSKPGYSVLMSSHLSRP